MTEEDRVQRERNESWKKCKLVESLTNTIRDINRCRGILLHAYNKLKNMLESKRVQLKMKVLNTYVKSIFLYNCDIWIITKELTRKISLKKKLYRVYEIVN